MNFKFDKLFLVGGVGAGKFFPIIFGIFLAREISGETYAAFVLLLNFCAVLTAISSMGATPRILRASATESPNKTVVESCLAGLFTTLIAILISAAYWLTTNSGFFGTLHLPVWEEVLLISVYSAGLTFIALSIPVCNYEKRWKVSGIMGVSVYACAFLVGLTFAVLFKTANDTLFAYALGLTVAAFFIFIYMQTKYVSIWGEVLREFHILHTMKLLFKNAYSSLFGVFFLFGFFYLNKTVNTAPTTTEPVLFSMGFQLFSLIIFIPSVLGNMLIPSASAEEEGAKRISMYTRMFFLYLTISLTICTGLILIRPFVYQLFHISHGNSYETFFIYVSGAAVLASINALLIQIRGVEGRFGLLAFCGVIWLAILMIFISFKNTLTAEYCFFALSSAYASVSLLMVGCRFFPGIWHGFKSRVV